jgi:RNA polymerase sigma-70 factor (ECF subfamily)
MDQEAIWVQEARAGDRAAFARLVERFQRPVYNLAYRMLGNPHDAEDAAQEAFLKAYRALAGYDPSRSFSTWLLSITAHHCIDRLRRKRLQQVSLDGLPPWRQLASDSVNVQRELEREDEGDRIRALLQYLPDEYRLVLVLRYWHDLGYSEIAETTGESVSAIKSRLHRARRRIAELLAEGDPMEPGLPAGAGSERAPAPSVGGWTRCMQTTYPN